MTKLAVAAGSFLIALASLRAAPGETSKVHYIDTPAAAGSSVPRVVARKEGLLLSWVESSAKGKAFRFSVLTAGRWSQPRTVADSAAVLAASSSEPGVLQLPGGDLVAQWLTQAPGKEANHIVVAVSHDGGGTWSKPVIPYRNSTPGEHMYVSLFPWPAGGAGVVWLDPRGGEKTLLMQTTIDRNGVLGPERTVDSDVCSCCPTSGVMTAAGPLLLYRGRSNDNVRDMQVTGLQNAAWQTPHAVHADGWKLNGCPTNSGGLSASGSNVTAVWFTGAPSKRVLLANSQNSGKAFGQPVVIDAQSPVGRAAVTTDAKGSALVAWFGSSAGKTTLFAARVSGGGAPEKALTIATSTSAAKLGFPSIASNGDTALLTWTENNGSSTSLVRAAMLR